VLLGDSVDPPRLVYDSLDRVGHSALSMVVNVASAYDWESQTAHDNWSTDMADSTGVPTSKIRIKMGQVEVEYEGSHAFLKDDLPALLETVVQLRERAGDANADDDESADEEEQTTKKKKKSGGKTTGTVGSIAAKVGVNSGTDLIIAAAAKLALVDGHEKFSRKELLNAMKTATNYYKKTYRNNLSAYLKSLQEGDRLTEQSSGSFALTAKEVGKLEALLAK
jgi:hypothetical protein